MIISGVKYQKQKDPMHCGPTVVSMALGKLGLDLTQEQIANVVMKVNRDGKRTAATYDICGYLVEHNMWPISIAKLPDDKAWNFLTDNLKKEILVLVTQRFSSDKKIGHFRLILGFYTVGKQNTQIVVYHDPLVGSYQEMKKEEFLELWRPLGTPTSSDIRVPNEMMIIYPSKPNLSKERCMSCGESDFKINSIDFHNRESEFQFFNNSTKINAKGTTYVCKSCGFRIAFFEP